MDTSTPTASTSTPSRHSQHSVVQVDPALLGLVGGQGLGKDVPVDPALFAIEQVVNDVRKGKIKEEQVAQVDDAPAQGAAGDIGMDIMDEEFDPALREIVNSLTNAQQSSNLLGTNLTQAQAQAAIDAHLSEEHDPALTFKTLEDLERAGFGMMNDQFGGPSDSFLLPDTTQPGSSDLTPAGSASSPFPASSSGPRRRGRPKGSKNKPKPVPPGPPPPPPPPKPAKKRGRPPKKRTEEELAEMEREKYAKENGIRKQKGRPRKFPGYLVREMRLKKNRAEFTELQRRYGDMVDHHHHHHGHVAGEDGQEHEGEGENGPASFWTDGMEQSILAAVEGLEEPSRHHQDMEVDVDGEDVPSSRAFEGGGDEMEMRRVFGLPADTEEHDDDGNQ